MILLDGKKTADEIQQELKTTISGLSGRKPCLAVILVGEHTPSQIYVKRKTQACEDIGILSIHKKLPSSISEEDLLKEVTLLNQNPEVDGILVQLPLPHHINPGKVVQQISPAKDVDGFHPVNVGKLLMGETDGFVSCTPLGIKTLLERYKIEVSGKHVVVFGRSNIVGKPVAALLMQNKTGANATVTVIHSYSKDIERLTTLADVLIVAIGKPNFVTSSMIKDGVVIVDVGINKIVNASKTSGYQIVGDVDFENVKDRCSYITPVPGGIGPMTIAMLLQNTLKSYLKTTI